MFALTLCALMTAQPPTGGDDQTVIRKALEPADLQALTRKVLAHDLDAGMMQKFMEAWKKDPGSLQKAVEEELRKNPAGMNRMLQGLPQGLPQELLPKQTREQIQQLAEAAKGAPSLPPPEHANNPFRNPEARPQPSPTPAPLMTNPPPRILSPALQRNPALKNALKIWEKNFGSIEKTPQLKKAIADLLNSSIDAQDQNGSAGDPFGSLLNTETEIGKEVAGWLDSAANGNPWNFDGLNIGDWKISIGETSGGGIGSTVPSNFDAPSGTSLGMLLFLAAMLAGLGYVLYWLRHRDATANIESTEAVLARLDPASIADRATLVRVFEEITIDTLGKAARTWNHATIAAAWQSHFNVSAADAGAAAAWYEAARYTPPQEPLPDAVIADARRWCGRFREAALR